MRKVVSKVNTYPQNAYYTKREREREKSQGLGFDFMYPSIIHNAYDIYFPYFICFIHSPLQVNTIHSIENKGN